MSFAARVSTSVYHTEKNFGEILALFAANGKVQSDRTRDEDEGLLERGTHINGES